MKKFLTLICLISISIVVSGYKKPDVFHIKPEKNAYSHNNLGLMYMNDKIYYAAIQEFKIAISLNPNTQATAVYYNNLGETYMLMGYPKYAQDCFERAIKLSGLNFKYYQNLAECFYAQGLTDLKLQSYSQDAKNPLNTIMVGLLLAQKGEYRKAIIKLDDYCMQEPDLIITNAVKEYIKTLTAKL